jgi:hypothetical protein
MPRRLVSRAGRAIEAGWLLVFVGLIAWIGVLLIGAARTKPFWHDEVYTILLSQLPLDQLWRASLEGVDLNPPLSVAAARGVHAVGGPGPVVTRLPSLCGFLLATALIFRMIQRRSNVLVAIAGASALAFTEAWRYALEARAYGLTLGSFAVALYGWSEAAAGRRPVRNWTLMGVAVAAGIWAHYYAVLVVLPIVAGEIVRQGLARRIDWKPWIALAAAGAAALPLWPLAAAASAQRTTFWARPRTIDIAGIYDFLRADFELPLVTAVALIGLIVFEVVRRLRRRDWPRRVPAHEAAAGLVALSLAAAAVLLGYWLGVFDRRYAILGAVGIALVLPMIVWAVTPSNGAGDLVMAATAVALLAQLSVRVFSGPAPWPHPYAARPILADWLRGSLPIVVTGGVEYLGLWYHAPPQARARAIYLADPEYQLRTTGTDTSDRGYLGLARWTDLPVVPIDRFLAAHDRFWLYSFGADWIENSLRERGARFEERGHERKGDGTLYEVFMKRLP